MAIDSEQPAFVITDMSTGHKFEIFASGQTRGFEHLERAVVFNRIPQLIAQAGCVTCAVRAGRLVYKGPREKPVFRKTSGSVSVMGASDLRDAFNAVSAPAFNCQRATLGYEHASDVEWQVLAFAGTAADGAPFETRSPRLRPGTDVNLAARATAQQLLDKGRPPA